MIKMCMCDECKIFAGIVDDKVVLLSEPIMFRYKCNVCGHTGYVKGYEVEEVEVKEDERD